MTEPKTFAAVTLGFSAISFLIGVAMVWTSIQGAGRIMLAASGPAVGAVLAMIIWRLSGEPASELGTLENRWSYAGSLFFYILGVVWLGVVAVGGI